jgi:phosphatidylglycerol:prolipoprotein diacylglycerol transferase
MVVGFLIGVYLAGRRAKRMGLDPNMMTDVGMIAIISGILGARLFYVIQFYKEFSGNFFEIFRVDRGGLVFYGGFLAAVVCVSIYCRRKQQSMAEILDIATPSLAVGLAFTRIGCFLNGCCWGNACSAGLPWAIRFPPGSGAFDEQVRSGALPGGSAYSLPVHPTQLYESLAAMALFFVTSWFFPYRKRKGDVLAAFAALYAVARFLIEFLRADNSPEFDRLTMSQNISIIAFFVGVTWLAWGRLNLGGQKAAPNL